MVREPLRQSKADLSRAKDTFERIHEIVVLYSSPFLIDMSSANLLWKRLHSSAMPPVVVKTKAVFTLGAWAPCPGSILRRAPMGTHLFSWYPRQNSGTVPVPEYKVSTLYSGTKLGTESLCEHIFRWCPGTLPTNHLFSYPQFLVPLEISIVSVCSVY